MISSKPVKVSPEEFVTIRQIALQCRAQSIHNLELVSIVSEIAAAQLSISAGDAEDKVRAIRLASVGVALDDRVPGKKYVDKQFENGELVWNPEPITPLTLENLKFLGRKASDFLFHTVSHNLEHIVKHFTEYTLAPDLLKAGEIQYSENHKLTRRYDFMDLRQFAECLKSHDMQLTARAISGTDITAQKMYDVLAIVLPEMVAPESMSDKLWQQGIEYDGNIQKTFRAVARLLIEEVKLLPEEINRVMRPESRDTIQPILQGYQSNIVMLSQSSDQDLYQTAVKYLESISFKPQAIKLALRQPTGTN